MTTPQHDPDVIQYLSDQLGEFSESPFNNPLQQFDAIMYTAAFCLGKATEDEIRECFAHTGVDLSNPETFEIAKDVVSVWVAGGGIEITDLHPVSLVEGDTPLVRLLQHDESLGNRIRQTHFEGTVFRDFVVAQDMV